MLYDKIGGRAVVIAEYVAETGATVRETAISIPPIAFSQNAHFSATTFFPPRSSSAPTSTPIQKSPRQIIF